MRIVVIGAGVTGLSAAYEIAKHLPNADLRVLEAGPRAGGLVYTEHTGQGLVIEHGADSLFAFKPEAPELVRTLGMEDQVVTGTDGSRTAYIVRDSQLIALPKGMLGLTPRSALGLMFSRLLSPSEKLRLLREPFIAARHDGTDESLRAFTTRRFGPAFLENIIEPLISGIHGAPTEVLSASAVMPHLVAFERNEGSIARAMFHAKERKVKGPPVVSLRRGMGSLPQALAAALQAHVTFDARVARIDAKSSRELRIELRSGDMIHADAVVLAVDALSAARLCESFSPDAAHELSHIPRAGYASVHLAFRKADIPRLPEGTGFVVPARESRRLKACTWVHQKWPDRAPDDIALLRCFMRAPYASDTELVNDALSDLRELLQIHARPMFKHILVRESALPCYTLGHLERVARIEQACADDSRLALAGNYLHGIGLSDCVASGQRAARQVMALVGRGTLAPGGARLVPRSPLAV